MEYISTYLADRMCRNDIIKEDDVKFYAYSIQLMLERVIGFILIGFHDYLLCDKDQFRRYSL